MIAPERGLLTGEVEIDEFFLGRHEDGLKGGRQHGKKALIGAVIEVRGPGSGRLRLQVLPARKPPLCRRLRRPRPRVGRSCIPTGCSPKRG